MNDHMGSSQRANISGRDGADQEPLQSMLVVQGHRPWISETQDEVGFEAFTEPRHEHDRVFFGAS